MEPIALSVSQLRNAVIDEDWRARFKRGENPSAQLLPPPGTVTVHGKRFHEFAYKLVNELTRRAEATARLSVDELFRVVYDLGAGAFITDLLNKSEIESAGILTEALHRFVQRLDELRTQRPEFNSWADVFIAQELSLSNVRLENSGPRLIFVSGSMDCVRRHPSGSIEIVDYKLTQGGHLDLEIVQIALYARLLRSSDPGLPLCGAIEYYHPKLHVTNLDEASVKLVYEQLVLPALKDLSTPFGADAVHNTPRPAAKPSAGLAPGPPRAAPDVESAPSATTASAAQPASRADIELGLSRGVSKEPVRLPTAELTRHTAVLGGSGSGKTTLALNIVEQVLEAGIPVLLLDRKGDLCRYAEPEAYRQGEARASSLREKLDVALFTPGHRSGRNLGIGILPRGLDQLDSTDREQAYAIAAASLASMMNYKEGKGDQAKAAILKRALGVLSVQAPASAVTLTDLIRLINSQDPALMESIGALNPKHCASLGENLQTLEIMQGELLAADEEMLSAELLFGLGSFGKSGKTRLSIISTKFLGDDKTALFWVAQLLVELSRFASRHPASTLQAVVMFDEADLYLPATSKPVTKTPMESLLKRARSAGLGVMLATQSPGDLDYKCRENVRSWFMGLVKEKTALEKLKPMASEANFDATTLLPKQKVGQFFMVTEKRALPFSSNRSVLETQQLAEARILELARQTR